MSQFSIKAVPQKPYETGKRLEQIEIEISRFDLDISRKPINILIMMDEAAAMISASGIQPDILKAERVQFEQLQENISKRAGAIINAAGGLKSFKQQREQQNPPVEFRWWYLDEFLMVKRKKLVQRTLGGLGVIVFILVLLFLGYSRFLAPDQKLIARLDHQNAAIKALLSRQYQQGLNEANLALVNEPDNIESLELKGMALTNLAESDQANQVFLIAQKKAGTQLDFYLTRSLEWITVNEPELGWEDAQKAINLDLKSAQGYWYRGKAEILLGQYSNAMNDFDQAILLANQENQMGMLVEIKSDLAVLMQSLQNGPVK